MRRVELGVKTGRGTRPYEPVGVRGEKKSSKKKKNGKKNDERTSLADETGKARKHVIQLPASGGGRSGTALFRDLRLAPRLRGQSHTQRA